MNETHRAGRATVIVTLILSLMAAGVSVPHAAPAQDERRTGLFEGLRHRLGGGGDPAEAYREALRIVSAVEAARAMEEVAGRGDDRESSGAAHLWLGHYRYGTGEVEAAAKHFEVAHERFGAGPRRDEAVFWTVQCRAVLGGEMPEAPEAVGLHGVLGAMASADADLRAGDWNGASQQYLILEDPARRAGVLGPLLYRMALVAASGRSAGRTRVDWSSVARVATDAPGSPERGLAAGLAPLAGQPPAQAAPPDGPVPYVAVAPQFVEEPGDAPTEAPDGELPPDEDVEQAPGAREGSADAFPMHGDPTFAEHGGVDDFRGDSSPPPHYYTVQLGAYRDRDAARREMERLTVRGLSVRLEEDRVNGTSYHKIRLGRKRTAEDAEAMARRLCAGLDWRVARVEM